MSDMRGTLEYQNEKYRFSFSKNTLYIRKPCTIIFYEKVVKWCCSINELSIYYDVISSYIGELKNG